MNRGEILAEIRRQVPYSDATDAQVNTRINEGHLRIASRCKLLMEDTTVLGVEDQQNYSLSTRFLDWNYDKPVTYANLAIEQKDIDWLRDKYGSTLTTDSGKPIYFWLSSDMISINLYPMPDSSNVSASTNVIIPSVLRPTDMTADTDIPWDSIAAYYDFHYLLVEYVVHKEKVALGEISQDKNSFEITYEVHLNQLKLKTKLLKVRRTKQRISTSRNTARWGGNR